MASAIRLAHSLPCVKYQRRISTSVKHQQAVTAIAAQGDHFPQQNNPSGRYPQKPQSQPDLQKSAPKPGGYSHINVEPPKRVVANNIGLKVGIAYACTFAINFGSNLGLFFGNTNAQVLYASSARKCQSVCVCSTVHDALCRRNHRLCVALDACSSRYHGRSLYA